MSHTEEIFFLDNSKSIIPLAVTRYPDDLEETLSALEAMQFTVTDEDMRIAHLRGIIETTGDENRHLSASEMSELVESYKVHSIHQSAESMLANKRLNDVYSLLEKKQMLMTDYYQSGVVDDFVCKKWQASIDALADRVEKCIQCIPSLGARVRVLSSEPARANTPANTTNPSLATSSSALPIVAEITLQPTHRSSSRNEMNHFDEDKDDDNNDGEDSEMDE